MVAMPGPLLLDGGDAINRGLVGFWPLTEGAGSLARDISPYRRNGALTNFGFTAGSGWRAGSFGKTLVFDGTDDLVENAAYSTTSNQPVSVFAWVNPSAFTNFAGVTTNLIEGTFLGWVLYLHGDQTVGTYLDAHRRSTNTIPANVWSHIGFAYNGSTVELYINGMLQRSDAGATYTGNTKFRIGNFYTTVNVGASRFAGAANSVRVFNRRVPASEVQRLYRDPWAGTLRTRRRVLATTGTPHTATPGAGAETYAGQGATVKAGATLLPGAGAETYAGKQAAVTAGATVAVGAGTETYQGLGAGVTQPATVAVGAGLVEVLGLQAALGSGLSGRVVRRGRYRTWDDVPTELAPVVSLAENYADELAVQRAVDDALARFAAMKAKTSIARRERLVDDLKRAIVAAVEEAAETDDEDALIALL